MRKNLYQIVFKHMLEHDNLMSTLRKRSYAVEHCSVFVCHSFIYTC